MSAAGRTDNRDPLDYYRTPEWCTNKLLGVEKFSGPILDPGCGDGAILEALTSAGVDRSGSLSGIEVDERRRSIASSRLPSASIWTGDFLAYGDTIGPLSPYHAVVGNPPYKLAAEFIRASLNVVTDYGRVCFLLRLNFLGSSRRRISLVGERSPLRSVWVLSRRPSFTGDGRTDACEYAWFTFVKGYRGPKSIRVLAP